VLVPGDVISYLEMCREEGVNLQRGMNFGSSGRPSIILMSRQPRSRLASSRWSDTELGLHLTVDPRPP
jgi:hypothetical protein